METIDFMGHQVTIISDQPECRRLIAKHNMFAVTTKCAPDAIVSGPLLEDDRKGFFLMMPTGIIRAYLFVEPMTVKQAIPLIVRMAQLGAMVAECPMEMTSFRDGNN